MPVLVVALSCLQTNVGEHLCKLPFCSRRFHTARALQIHCTNSHAPFRFYPEDTGPKERDRVTGALSKAWGHGENDTGSVVASVLDLVVRRVEYDAASTSERARMRYARGAGGVGGTRVQS